MKAISEFVEQVQLGLNAVSELFNNSRSPIAATSSSDSSSWKILSCLIKAAVSRLSEEMSRLVAVDISRMKSIIWITDEADESESITTFRSLQLCLAFCLILVIFLCGLFAE